MGVPNLPHSLTYIPDLAEAIVWCAAHADSLSHDRVLHTSTLPPSSLRQIAYHLTDKPMFTRVPTWMLQAVGLIHPMVRERARMSYLWTGPCTLNPGVLEEHGLAPTVLDRQLAH
ncbi:Rossmann-fold NAD(P)-binding domain-containing protein [Devriesea agamarum]|uniref:hypothetical protein n=1 Tax=Devriesea agamarum TaxID=472569 RepID=UPI00071D28FA|nr:hypothetical protein [Devriesea agamarum]